MNFNIRIATLSDKQAIELLINHSVNQLAVNDYTQEQIDIALKTAWGVDTQLITDKTYYIVETQNHLIGAGGWSFRKTLFGNNQEPNRNPEKLNPQYDYAKIRAFFVAPKYARKGIGSLIMQHCEKQAIKAGFKGLELMSTLPGKPLYEHHGFTAKTSINYQLNDTIEIEFVPMFKKLKKHDLFVN
ncbi:GNAT family N-acetyltransferase [Aliikangiella sp. IMCC44359]|uniref:GNAT family N-acetyltransferase n=1 Tax=Aliikangiella sp. IMCC44359 TaxID=3459125 RepID=UPI00403AB5D7